MTMAAIKQYNQRVLDSLKEGDIILIPREKYDHYAVYIGDGYVVHFGKDEKGNICVKQDDIFKVCMNSKAKKCNYLDGKKRPLDSKEIVARAKSMIGKTGYDLLTQNCEHLATFCRYGIKYSQQVLTGIWSITFIIILVGIFFYILVVCKQERSNIEDLFNDGQDFFHPASAQLAYLSGYLC